MDQKIIELAQSYRPLAIEILAEAIRIPADYVDKPVSEGGDPQCGLSNHEGPRLHYLRDKAIAIGAVASAEDIGFDGFGNLWWRVLDPNDGIADDDRVVVYLDGHTDTVQALRDQWHAKIGPGLDPYNGLTDREKISREVLSDELGFIPPAEEWEHVLFGRGSADQLAGVVCQIVATKIMRELIAEGALHGVTVYSYATVAEEDNDGGGPMYLMRHELPGAPPGRVPDVVILTEGTGCAHQGALGIYRGQRGRMQIEVTVTGRSCHGSMPWEGKNPLEYGGAIIAEAAAAYDARDGFLDHEFLGHGTRTASWTHLDTPSNCAVPQRFVFRFDRRLTIGETPEQAVSDVEALPSVSRAREDGLTVEVKIPFYTDPTWKGVVPGNPEVYAGWITPEEHPAIQAALDAYARVASPMIPEGGTEGQLRKEVRLSRWIFSTDGVGFPVPEDATDIHVPASKQWVTSGAFKHPAMFGIGPGIEQNTHKIGECLDVREFPPAIAVIARFPSLYRESLG